MKKSNITDEEIEKAFEGANFGGCNRRKLLEQGVLKRICGYYNGQTLKMILIALGLTNVKEKVLKKGLNFIFNAFHESVDD